jgi:16S rRNA (cytidine1402-2'-O)-methyltransferase
MSTDPDHAAPLARSTLPDAAPLPAGLYVVATPIGNLQDLTARAATVLRQARAIACEDTRVTRVLCQHIGSSARLIACHAHNESSVSPNLVAFARDGHAVALVSDAGTPAISDPGARVVDAFRGAGIPVWTVPGPCAIAAAMSIAGPFGPGYTFAGFLPIKGREREAALAAIGSAARPTVLYEATQRMVTTLGDMAAHCEPLRRVFIGRELTKRFEESVVVSLADAVSWLQDPEHPHRDRGEFVVIVDAAPARAAAEEDIERHAALLRCLLQELPASRAAKVAAELTGNARQALYSLALRLAKTNDDD